MDDPNITRRSLLKLSATGIMGGSVLVGCRTIPPPPEVQTITRWDEVKRAVARGIHRFPERVVLSGVVVADSPLLIDGPVNISGHPLKIVSAYNPNVGALRQGDQAALLQVGSPDGIEFVSLTGITIDGHAHAHRGISAENVRRLMISDTQIHNTGMIGIWAAHCENVDLAGNHLSGCLVGNPGNLEYMRGTIRLEHCTNSRVSGNIVLDSYGKGIAFRKCQQCDVTQNTVKVTLHDAGDALYQNECAHVTFAFNACMDPQGSGIKLSRSTSDGLVIANQIHKKRRGRGAGIMLQGVRNCGVFQNSVWLEAKTALTVVSHPHETLGGPSTAHIVTGNHWRGSGFIDSAHTEFVMFDQEAENCIFATNILAFSKGTPELPISIQNQSVINRDNLVTRDDEE